jgi:arsenate reductase
MAEGFLKSFHSGLEIHSAGTDPADHVHPKAVAVMREIGIDISNHRPKLADEFLHWSFDYVITVCDHAKETCPAFTGDVKHRLHMGFDDPALAKGTEDEISSEFRRIRDEIRGRFKEFYEQSLKAADSKREWN